MLNRCGAANDKSIRLYVPDKSYRYIALACAISVFLIPLAVPAQALRLIPFQARMTDTSGNVLNGVYSATFSIYDAATGGTAQWVETHPNVSIVGGQLNVFLGSIRSLDDANGDSNPNDPVDFGASAPAKFVGVTIGTGSEMVPRHQLVPAFHARTADVASIVKDGAITAVMLAPGAVTADKILDGSIGSADLQAAPFISGANILPASLTTGQLQDGAVTGTKLDPALLSSINLSGGTLAQVLDVVVETRRTVWLKDYKAATTPAQTIAGGAPGTERILNTIEGDASIVSLTGGTTGVGGTATRFVLQPGEYEIEAWASGRRASHSAIRLVDVTSGNPIINFQQNAFSASEINSGVSASMLSGKFSLVAPTTLAIVQRIQTAISLAAGQPAGFSLEQEVYAVVKIVKVDQRSIASRIADPF